MSCGYEQWRPRPPARNVGQQNDVVAALVGRRVARGEEALFGMDMVWGRQAVNEQGIVRVSRAADGNTR